MTLQYESNDEYEEYSASKTSIGLTFSNKKGKFLPYIRQYDSLNEEKLLDLINIAKKNGMDSIRFIRLWIKRNS